MHKYAMFKLEWAEGFKMMSNLYYLNVAIFEWYFLPKTVTKLKFGVITNTCMMYSLCKEVL